MKHLKKLTLLFFSIIFLSSCVEESYESIEKNSLLKRGDPTVLVIPDDGGSGGGSSCKNTVRYYGNCDYGYFDGQFKIDNCKPLTFEGDVSRNNNGEIIISNLNLSFDNSGGFNNMNNLYTIISNSVNYNNNNDTTSFFINYKITHYDYDVNNIPYDWSEYKYKTYRLNTCNNTLY